jgi:hypothetical protein
MVGRRCRWKAWSSRRRFQLEALLNVLESKGVIRKAEVLEEIKRLKKGQPQGR